MRPVDVWGVDEMGGNEERKGEKGENLVAHRCGKWNAHHLDKSKLVVIGFEE